MATSRTGTTQWLKARRACLTRDEKAGILTCPLCGVTMNYRKGREPNSAEADHIIPHALGGTDEVSNLRAICRRCNQSRGARTANTRPLRTSREW